MPAQRHTSGSVSVSIYDVVGFDSPDLNGFIGHVALAAMPLNLPVSGPQRIRITHMMPPLHTNQSGLGQCFGSIGLEESHVRSIGTFIRETENEYRAEQQRRQTSGAWDPSARNQFREDQYTIHPPVREASADRPFRQFSCAGFVTFAYSYAGIPLVRDDELSLPQCTLQSLKVAYAPMQRRLDDALFRSEKGIPGTGPWPLLLPGHLLNSLNRRREQVLAQPYHAQLGDEFFPSRPLGSLQRLKAKAKNLMAKLKAYIRP
jgi:hypothetical protein